MEKKGILEGEKRMNMFEPVMSEKAIKLVEETLRSGFVNMGPRVKEFEEILEEDEWAYNPVMLNSCTSALHLALILSNVKSGDEVILPSQTFIATGLAVLMVGGKPVWADIQKNGKIDPYDVIRKINKNTKAIITVNWGGQSCDEEIDIICEYIKDNNLIDNIKLISDSAQSFGNPSLEDDSSPYDFECFSLQAIKTLSAGDSGILCCKKEEDLKEARKLRWFGIDKDLMKRGIFGERLLNVSELGFKYNPTDIDASLAIGNLDEVNYIVAKRNELAARYISLLPSHVYLPSFDSTDWFYNICVDHDRDNLLRKLRKEYIPATIVDKRIDTNPIFGKNDHCLPGQDWYDSHVVDLPCNHKMTISDVDFIVKLIREGW